MRKLLTACLASALVLSAAPSADAAVKYTFKGDAGTRCVVEVGSVAQQGINALQLPRVGFTAAPVCSYAAPGAAAGAKAKAKARAKAKRCRAKAKKRGHRGKRCGGKRGKPRTYAVPADRAAAVEHANLLLLSGNAVVLPGEETLAALGLGGYTCILRLGVNCGDLGNLSPATPYVSYLTRYTVTVVPPPGERWIERPAQCGAGAEPTCTLEAPPVVPVLL